MESMEPFIVDHLQLQLTGGSEGYRVHLKHVEIYGASNFSVQRLKLAEDDQPFELSVYIPKLTIKAKYSSSGVLIIIPASGGGDFAAIFGTTDRPLIIGAWNYSHYFLIDRWCDRRDQGQSSAGRRFQVRARGVADSAVGN